MKKTDFFLKYVTPLLTIITIVIGVIQYSKNSEREFRKEFYQAQLQVYLETSQVLSVLVNTPTDQIGSQEYNNARKRFFEIKYGQLFLVQDTLVEGSYVDFTNHLLRYERIPPKVSQSELTISALKVNEAFRKSIQRTWGIELQMFKRKENDIIK